MTNTKGDAEAREAAAVADLKTKTTIPVWSTYRPDVCDLLHIGRERAYEAVRSGEIPSIRVGGRALVPTAPMRRMLGVEADTEATAR